jgi:hypothetical protein
MRPQITFSVDVMGHTLMYLQIFINHYAQLSAQRISNVMLPIISVFSVNMTEQIQLQIHLDIHLYHQLVLLEFVQSTFNQMLLFLHKMVKRVI